MSETLEDLFDFPDYWPSTRLGEIAEVISPGFPCGDHNREGSGVPHLRPMNISEKGEIDLSKVKYVEEDYTPLRAGDVLFNNTNSPVLVGKTAHIDQDQDWAHSNHMTRIRGLADGVSSKWVANWLHFLFQDGYFRMHCRNHVNQASIGVNFLKDKVDVPLPPLPEQRRIVAKIEELFSNLDAGMDDLQAAGQQLERYRLSVLQAAVEGRLTADWRRTHDPEPADQLLERILEKKQSLYDSGKIRKPKSGDSIESEEIPYSLPSAWTWSRLTSTVQRAVDCLHKTAPFEDEDTGYYCVDTTCMTRKEIEYDELRPVSEETYEEWTRRMVPKPGDVLFSREGTVGLTAVIPEGVNLCLGQRVMIFRLPDSIVPEYFHITLLSPTITKQWKRCLMGTTASRVNIGDIRQFLLPIPPTQEQKEIVAEVERLESVANDAAATADREYTRAARLRQSILKQAFSGRLVPHDEDADPPAIETSSSNGVGQGSSGDTGSSSDEVSSSEDDVVAEELYNGGDPGKQIEMDL